ncbi:CDGSH iron-sulfur domain-containing protein [Vallitaleaceae bacterium 9-2]
MSENPQERVIQIQKNGPIKVINPPRLKIKKGVEKFSDPSKMIPKEINLCRCGYSKDKPFCDGSHFVEEFDEDKGSQWEPGKRKDYIGERTQITITDNRRICAHVGYCLSDLPLVFDKYRHPWIITDNGSVEDIIRAIRRCPSGALAYRLNGIEYQAYHAEPEIIVIKNGPYIVQGGIRLEGEKKPETQDHYTLCRCGHSKNKPFCDGEHIDQSFNDEGE